MSQFATSDVLAARLGITLTADEETRADTLLTLATGLIQDAAKQTIEQVEDDDLMRPGSYDDRIRLPQRPVTEVSAITAALIGGAPADIADDSWYLDGDEIVRAAFPLGIERHFFTAGNGWLGPTFTLTITYTHGYSTVPDLARAVCLEAAVRAWTNPAALRAETYGSEQIQYQPGSGLLLSETERRQLGDRFRRQAGSVALR